VHQAKRILEVACGAGNHSLVLATTYLKRGSVLVSTDFSSQMMEFTKKRFEDKELGGPYNLM
jgi:ubiquinone/menaquinone biosynthesis C-methylase UbiE